MKLVYFSNTGQTRKFVKKLDMDSLELTPTNPFIEVHEDFIVIAPCYEKEVTDVIDDFIGTGNNIKYCKGVIGGGNRNFADLFCYTAKDFAVDYNVPYLHEFEFQGSPNDVAAVQNIANEIESGAYKYLTPREQGYLKRSKKTYTRSEFFIEKIKIV